MKITTTMKKQLNEQIELEANASSAYLAMASWAEMTGYDGAANYFYAQSDEERIHMLKIVKYMNTVGVGATIPKTNQPLDTFKSLEMLIKSALQNERTVTKAIHKMVKTAQKDDDHATYDFLSWFVKEQIHEEAQFEALLQKFDIIGRDNIAVNEIDKIMASKTAAGPTAADTATSTAPI